MKRSGQTSIEYLLIALVLVVVAVTVLNRFGVHLF